MLKLQVGVKVFLKNEEGEYLLLKRNQEKYPSNKGNWDIVGGRIDPGTRLIENLKREVYEETQLEIVSDPQLIFAQDIILDEKHVVRLTYEALCSGEIILDAEENVEYKWISSDEILKQDDLDIYTKEILENKLEEMI